MAEHPCSTYYCERLIQRPAAPKALSFLQLSALANEFAQLPNEKSPDLLIGAFVPLGGAGSNRWRDLLKKYYM